MAEEAVKETLKQQNSARVFFDADAARRLSVSLRLPPTYIGVRRVRPSNSTVQTVMTASTTTTDVGTTNGPVIVDRTDETVPASAASRSSSSAFIKYTVTDENGIERRMTAAEKKKRRRQHREETKARKKREREEFQQAKDDQDDDEVSKRRRKTSLAQVTAALQQLHSNGQQRQVGFAIAVDATLLEQEIADLRGERDGVPPVALAPCLVPLLQPNPHTFTVLVDDNLAGRWAVALKNSMKPAELVRQREDIRPMVYDSQPLVWTRLRPEGLEHGTGESTMERDESSLEPPVDDRTQTVAFEIRPSVPSLDKDLAAVARALHRGKSLHVSCGAKFGSDFLLYKAPRDAVHAFAGLRVVRRALHDEFPLPSAYHLTGYIRCLNTAAKLALLAFVQWQTREDGTEVARVALVDLNLVKVVRTRSDAA